MEMGVIVQLLAPGVEHGEATNLRPEMFGGLGNVLECLGNGAKEQAIEWARVLEHQRPQVVWQGKDDMGVGRLEHLAFPSRKPRRLRRAMTFGAATVAAGVVRLDLVATLVALGDVAPERSRPTHRDGAQRPVLRA
jgi:hypothetical protein